MDDLEKIRLIVKRINDAWSSGRIQELHQYFHPAIVVVRPGFKGQTSGRDACVDSYRWFWENATIHSFTTGEPSIEVWGTTAVALYRFEMDYTVGGERHQESAHDVFVFARDGEHWIAVWRTMV